MANAKERKLERAVIQSVLDRFNMKGPNTKFIYRHEGEKVAEVLADDLILIIRWNHEDTRQQSSSEQD